MIIFNIYAYERQFVFQKIFSTTDTIFELYKQIRNILNSDKQFLDACMDLTEAFDTVPQICFYECCGLMLKVFYFNKPIQIRIRIQKVVWNVLAD